MEPLTPADPTAVGDYRLLGRLGSGGMGQVYLGVSPAADKVAVKVIKPELVSGVQLRERFALEIDSLKMVYGARVARFEGADLDASIPWLAVEYVPGQTLYHRVQDDGPMAADIAALLGAMLAEGLSKIHEAGLLHRDLKPQNILLGPDGPKVIDFGLAALRDRGSHLTETGMVVGTVAYMPPEQARGDSNATTSVDVYALGATLVYALTGHNVYTAAHVHALLIRITNPDDHPDLSDLPAQLAALVTSMLAFDPEARPALGVVKAHLLQVATAGGHTVEQVREQLVLQTYIDAAPSTGPIDSNDPLAEDSDLVAVTSSASTRLEQPSPPSTAAPRATPTANVDWLVERLRKQYAREAAF